MIGIFFALKILDELTSFVSVQVYLKSLSNLQMISQVVGSFCYLFVR